MKSICCFLGALGLLLVFSTAQLQGQEGRRVYEGRPIYHGGFEVEVLVNGISLEKLHGRGRTYIEAAEGAEYELRIHNPLPVRVAVALSVDGLNTIDARRSSSWDSSKWVIEPYGTLRVGGWQMSSERARRFYFTTERDSYAAKLGRTSDLGLITAVFFREAGPAITYGRRQPRPLERREEGSSNNERAENAPQSSASRKTSPHDGMVTGEGVRRDDEYAATGIGRSVSNSVQRIHLDLDRKPVADVALRYEYRPALVKLGILPRPRPYDDPLRRRERAKGFEDSQYCPEP